MIFNHTSSEITCTRNVSVFFFDISETIRLATYIGGSLGKLRTFSGRRLSPEEFEVFKEMVKTLRCCAPEGPPLVAKVPQLAPNPGPYVKTFIYKRALVGPLGPKKLARGP